MSRVTGALYVMSGEGSVVKIGIVGPEGSGKSTVFACLTGLGAPTATRSPSLGVVRVPDARLEVLSAMYRPKKTTPAEITFVDLGSAGRQERLSAITGCLADADALAIVVGGLSADPPGVALERFMLDLILADLSVVENRLERLDKDLQRGRREAAEERDLMGRLQAALSEGRRIAEVPLDEADEALLRGFQFTTRKPTMVLANVSEQDLGNGVARSVAAVAEPRALRAFELCAPLEAEIAELADDDRADFLADYGLECAATDRFIRAAYEMLDLISFFTVGPDEVRAWSIRRGTRAPRAAGKIHSDIERGFIRAEVVAYEHLATAGSMAACRAQGQVRLEGREYEVCDGDVIEFRFSV